MATQLGELVFKITGDNSDAKKKLHETDTTATKTASGVSGSMKKIGAAIIAAFAIDRIISFGKTLVAASSAAAETRQKFGVVFEGIREEADRTAVTFAKSFGLSNQAAEEYLSTTGNLLQSIGFTEKASLDLSVALNSTAADLVSFTNYSGGMSGAANAVQSALLGEREALKGLGIAISENDLVELAKQHGQLYKNMSKTEQAMLTLELIQSRSANAMGDFSRSSDSFANVSRTINGRIDDMATMLGDDLTPALSELGRAFLVASEDGGIIFESLKLIGRAASSVITQLARLIMVLDNLGGNNAVEKKLKDLNYAQDRHLVAGKKINEQAAAYRKSMGDTSNRTYSFAQNLKYLRDIAEGGGKNQWGARAVVETYDKWDGQVKALSTDTKKLADESVALADSLAGVKGPTIPKEGTPKKKLADSGKTGGGEPPKTEKPPTIQLDEMTKQILAIESAMGVLDDAASILWDTLTPEEKVLAGISAVTSALSGMNDMMGNVGNLAAAVYSSMGEDLEEQRSAELEAAGVKEDTAVEAAQKEYDLALKGSNNEEKIEKKKALDRAVINEKYNKKKAQLEYEAAMVGWEIQMAQAVATSAMAILNAGMAGFKYGPVTASLFAGYATVFSGMQVAAINYSKPRPPKYEDGGIVPGSSFSGDTNMARVNSGEMIINTKDQNSLWEFIKGGAAAGSTIHLTVNLGAEKFFETITQAVRDREIIIDSGSVV